MGYAVQELAERAGITVDTVRYYQTQGLLEPPRRVGRNAEYSDDHLGALREIRKLKDEGLSLAVIRRLLTPGASASSRALRDALSEESREGTIDRAQLARESGVPEELIIAVEQAGLVEPIKVGDESRYQASDVELARSALAVMKEGLPLGELLQLATEHADHVRDVTDRATEMFDQHVRRGPDGERDPQQVVDAFRRLLPAVTTLVAHHFQRTLLSRALARLEQGGDREGLEHAVRASDSAHLKIHWD